MLLLELRNIIIVVAVIGVVVLGFISIIFCYFSSCIRLGIWSSIVTDLASLLARFLWYNHKLCYVVLKVLVRVWVVLWFFR